VPLDGPVAMLNDLGLAEPDLEAIHCQNAAGFFRLPLAGGA
jgi:hypothetical protein